MNKLAKFQSQKISALLLSNLFILGYIHSRKYNKVTNTLIDTKILNKLPIKTHTNKQNKRTIKSKIKRQLREINHKIKIE